MSDHRTIGIDWGTSRLRAYLIAADGKVLDRRQSDSGILSVPAGAFPAALRSLIADWRDQYPGAEIVASGMVGSRQGWREVPYVSCPTGLDDLVAMLASVAAEDLGRIRLVPGIAGRDQMGMPDVMRGEETQIIGASRLLGPGTHVLVLPGTHSKWAVLQDGVIVSFATYMTGELFAVLRAHSILGRLMEATMESEESFLRGVDAARANRTSLLHRLFSVRTLGLFGELPASSIESYLSGLLIGTEIVDAVEAFGSNRPVLVNIIAGAELAQSYEQALTRCALASRRIGEEATALGLWLIAGHARNSAS
jgi:2-dehydro-3-deoxygalactonokinase